MKKAIVCKYFLISMNSRQIFTCCVRLRSATAVYCNVIDHCLRDVNYKGSCGKVLNTKTVNVQQIILPEKKRTNTVAMIKRKALGKWQQDSHLMGNRVIWVHSCSNSIFHFHQETFLVQL